MKIIVLISCMYEKDTTIITRSNVQTDVVVVNQCDIDSVEEFDFVNKKGEICHAKFINSTERGLSKSRNLAILNAWGDYCQISDDDEVFPDNHADIIKEAYFKYPNASVITFALDWKDSKAIYLKKECKLGLVGILRTSSQQITFSLAKIKEYGITFDVKMGSGTGNGGGEENRFLIDCKKCGLRMVYYPKVIALIVPGDSKWFKGYDEKYFRDRGWTSRRNLGFVKGLLFIIYNAFNHKREFTKNGVSFYRVVKNMVKGFFEKR